MSKYQGIDFLPLFRTRIFVVDLTTHTVYIWQKNMSRVQKYKEYSEYAALE